MFIYLVGNFTLIRLVFQTAAIVCSISFIGWFCVVFFQVVFFFAHCHCPLSSSAKRIDTVTAQRQQWKMKSWFRFANLLGIGLRVYLGGDEWFGAQRWFSMGWGTAGADVSLVWDPGDWMEDRGRAGGSKNMQVMLEGSLVGPGVSGWVLQVSGEETLFVRLVLCCLMLFACFAPREVLGGRGG
jgi:hypothetical protein